MCTLASVYECMCACARLSSDRRATNQTTVHSWDYDVLFRPHVMGHLGRYMLHINTAPRYWQCFPQVSIHRLTTDENVAVNYSVTALRFRLLEPSPLVGDAVHGRRE